MTDESRRRWSTIALACIGLGAVLIVASLLISRSSLGQSGWTTEDAKALQQSATRLHELSFSVTPSSSAEEKQRLADARAERDRLNQERLEAISAAKWLIAMLRWSGIALVIVGVVAYWQSRQGE